MNKTLASKALLVIFALYIVLAFLPAGSAQDTAADNADTVAAAEASAKGLIAIGAGLAVGLAGLGSAWGESTIGAAAVGAMAEDERLFGKGLIMTVLPETIVIFGLVVSLLLIFVY